MKIIHILLVFITLNLIGDNVSVKDTQIKSLIRDVCIQLGDKYAKEEALDIVYATGLVESKYEYIEQIGTGPAKSY